MRLSAIFHDATVRDIELTDFILDIEYDDEQLSVWYDDGYEMPRVLYEILHNPDKTTLIMSDDELTKVLEIESSYRATDKVTANLTVVDDV